MVSYCCVNGCSNNSGDKKKHPNINTTFHAFPSNLKLRSKWLKAIGRPTWDPPQHARVCSVHFTEEQINREYQRQRTRLKDDAVPAKDLPETLFPPSSLEVCRICLVTEVKMFSMQNEVLKICFKSVVGMAKDTEGLPPYVCYECAAQLLRCHRLVERSLVARTTLLGLLAKHGQITKHHINKVNRTKLNLISSLSYNRIVPKTLIDLHYDEDELKYTHKSEIQENALKMEVENQSKSDDFNIEMQKVDLDNKLDFNDLINDYKYDNVDDNFVSVDVKSDVGDNDMSDGNIDGIDDETDDVMDDLPLVTLKMRDADNQAEKKPKQAKPKKKSAPKNSEGLTPEEVEMQKHFNIVIQTLQEQIEERLRMKESAAYRDGLYKCEICYKTYLHPNAYKVHMEQHDPSKGPAECPVCLVRFGSEARAAAHAQRAHAKRFRCRRCPKVFANVRLARKHLRRHEGFIYKCDECDFSSIHESALSAHRRAAHVARFACACGLAFASARGLKLHARKHKHAHAQPVEEMFLCRDCDVRFATEEAWRVHMLTAKAHSGDRALPAHVISLTCARCGVRFDDARALHAHASEHVQALPAPKRSGWAMPGDRYPTECEHCGETVKNRKEHYFHVRRAHPRERQTYRPVVTAVCETCGKGFQNSTKLHLHELRHGGAGTVRCPHCPRLFYDKYQLARHAGVHSDARPHQCRLCDKAFKLRSNLDRHAKVHSGATPYECTMCGKRFRYTSSRNLHIRTVHYKLPQPPRKKRPSKARVAYDVGPPIMQQ